MYQHRSKDQRQIRIAFKLFACRKRQKERHIVENAIRHQIEQLIGLRVFADQRKLRQQGEDRLDHTGTRQRSDHGHHNACHRIDQTRENVFLFRGIFGFCIHSRLVFEAGHPDQIVVDFIHLRSDDDLKLTGFVNASHHTVDFLHGFDICFFGVRQMEPQPGNAVCCGQDIFLAADRAQDLVDEFLVVIRHNNFFLLFPFGLVGDFKTDRETAAAQFCRSDFRQLADSIQFHQTGVFQGGIERLILKFTQAGVFFSADQRQKFCQKLFTIHRENLPLVNHLSVSGRTRASPAGNIQKNQSSFRLCTR